MTPKILPGTVEVAGKQYIPNPRGDLTPVENVRPQDLLMHEMVYRQIAFAKNLSCELGRFLTYTEAEIASFDALLAQQYGVERSEEKPKGKGKGNRTFTSLDGLLKVTVRVADRETYGPELQQAKTLLDEMVQERSTDADPFLIALVNQAFKVDREGLVDRASLMALRRLEVDDPRWPNICKAIDESRRPIGTKRYIVFHERETADGQWRQIVLDHASIDIGAPEYFEAPRTEAVFDAIRAELQKARDLGIPVPETVTIGDGVAWLVEAFATQNGRTADVPPTEQEIVDGANALARTIYGTRGYVVAEGYRFDQARHPHEMQAWEAACAAYQVLLGIDVENAVAEATPGESGEVVNG